MRKKRSYYTGTRAASYNRTWREFSEKTLAVTRSVIDFTQLRQAARARGEAPCILDAACGTGLLLQQLADLIPEAELYGVDASQEMLAQAQLLLGKHPRIHLAQASLKKAETAGLPYAPASFDLITCTNALHYLNDPEAVLRELAVLLTKSGQLVIEDYARRAFPFPWKSFEWLIRQVDPQHIRAYSLMEVQRLCRAAGLEVMTANTFRINALWQGWVLRGEVHQ